MNSCRKLELPEADDEGPGHPGPKEAVSKPGGGWEAARERQKDGPSGGKVPGAKAHPTNPGLQVRGREIGCIARGKAPPGLRAWTSRSRTETARCEPMSPSGAFPPFDPARLICPGLKGRGRAPGSAQPRAAPVSMPRTFRRQSSPARADRDPCRDDLRLSFSFTSSGPRGGDARCCRPHSTPLCWRCSATTPVASTAPSSRPAAPTITCTSWSASRQPLHSRTSFDS